MNGNKKERYLGKMGERFRQLQALIGPKVATRAAIAGGAKKAETKSRHVVGQFRHSTKFSEGQKVPGTVHNFQIERQRIPIRPSSEENLQRPPELSNIVD